MQISPFGLMSSGIFDRLYRVDGEIAGVQQGTSMAGSSISSIMYSLRTDAFQNYRFSINANLKTSLNANVNEQRMNSSLNLTKNSTTEVEKGNFALFNYEKSEKRKITIVEQMGWREEYIYSRLLSK